MREGDSEYLTLPQSTNQMVYELEEFLKLIKEEKNESNINTFDISRKSVEILSRVRYKV